MEKLKYADELIKTNSWAVKAGFNMFINGHSEPKYSEYGDKQECHSRMQGYDYAKEMAKTESISFTYPFKCEQNSCSPFQYGGFWVCNSCGGKDVNKKWWEIKVEKDGNEYCCHGLDFENLQESENYAFGKTFETAIENYRKAILNIK